MIWEGPPAPITITEAEHTDELFELTGTAGSQGVVEGTVRVLSSPDGDLEEGEILVCHTTDPGWTPLFMVAAAIIIDIGGLMSHGPIVARELGLPCVINTVDGTRRLRTGDRVRVDGATGLVTVFGTTCGTGMSGTSWGPLATPVRTDAPDRDDVPWRDNGYIGFWDVDRKIVGCWHFSTSPTAVHNRKISFQLVAPGQDITIMEELAPREDQLGIDLLRPGGRGEHRASRGPRPPSTLGRTWTRSSTADIIPALEDAAHPFHAQGGGRATGWVEIDGERMEVAGGSFRDRTAGFRNDGETFPEYVLVMASFDGLNLSALKLQIPGGQTVCEGFAVTPETTTKVTDLTMVRTGTGHFHSVRIELEGGEAVDLHSVDALGRISIPIGPPSPHPVLMVLEEFHALGTEQGHIGGGIVEQGIVHSVGSVPHTWTARG